jgi:hypothetical protein
VSRHESHAGTAAEQFGDEGAPEAGRAARDGGPEWLSSWMRHKSPVQIIDSDQPTS